MLSRAPLTLLSFGGLWDPLPGVLLGQGSRWGRRAGFGGSYACSVSVSFRPSDFPSHLRGNVTTAEALLQESVLG